MTTAASLEAFRRRVFEDESLQRQLQGTADPGAFVALVVQLGREHGHSFTAQDVEEALRESRKAWRERWQA